MKEIKYIKNSLCPLFQQVKAGNTGGLGGFARETNGDRRSHRVYKTEADRYIRKGRNTDLFECLHPAENPGSKSEQGIAVE